MRHLKDMRGVVEKQRKDREAQRVTPVKIVQDYQAMRARVNEQLANADAFVSGYGAKGGEDFSERKNRLAELRHEVEATMKRFEESPNMTAGGTKHPRQEGPQGGDQGQSGRPQGQKQQSRPDGQQR
jgi:hypothetical protein